MEEQSSTDYNCIDYRKKEIDLTLIVSALNEEGNILRFYDEASKSADDHSRSLEIIFVDDGSTDGTYNMMIAAAHRASLQDHVHVQVISFSRNFGKESAMYAGLQKANGRYIGFIDADLQQLPDTAFEMLNKLELNPEYDCVAAFQEQRNAGSFTNWFSHLFYSVLSESSGMDVIQDASDFRIFKSEVGNALLSMPEYHRFSKGLFAWIGFKTLPFPYTPCERYAGESTWSFKKLMKYAIDGLLSFTTFPLRIATYLGLIVSLVAFLYILVVILQRIFMDIDIPGYATIVVLILFLGGIQLLVLGIIGEYIARICTEGKHRPIYIERRYLDSDAIQHDERC